MNVNQWGAVNQWGEQTPPPQDTTAPIVTNNGSATLTIIVGDTYTPDFSTNEGTLSIDNPVDTNTPNTYTVTATAIDAAGNVGSATQTVIVESAQQENQAPTAIIQPVGTVSAGQEFQLDASLSSDPEDGAITQFGWEQISGDAVTIQNANSATPTIIAPSEPYSQILTFRVITLDSEGLNATATIDIPVNSLVESEVLEKLEVLDFELVTQGNITAYKGRLNREVLRFKPSSSEGLELVNEHLNLSSNGITKIEVVSGDSSIDSESESVKISGEKLLVRFGDLDIADKDAQNVSFFIVFYIDGDTKGLVVAANGTSGYKPLGYRVVGAAAA